MDMDGDMDADTDMEAWSPTLNLEHVLEVEQKRKIKLCK